MERFHRLVLPHFSCAAKYAHICMRHIVVCDCGSLYSVHNIHFAWYALCLFHSTTAPPPPTWFASSHLISFSESKLCHIRKPKSFILFIRQMSTVYYVYVHTVQCTYTNIRRNLYTCCCAFSMCGWWCRWWNDDIPHLNWTELKLYMIGSHARVEYRLKIGIEWVRFQLGHEYVDIIYGYEEWDENARNGRILLCKKIERVCACSKM